MPFTVWGVAGIIGGVLYDKYRNYQAAFYTAAVLAAVALVCELPAKRPSVRVNAARSTAFMERIHACRLRHR